MTHTSGFTFIEIILVIALVLIIGTTTSPFITRFIVDNNLVTTRNQVVTNLRKAQQYSMNSRNDSLWGICYTSSTIRLYTGTCVSPTYSEDFDVSSSISVSGLSDTTFSQRGEPSSTLSITVSSAHESISISINTVGGLTIN